MPKLTEEILHKRVVAAHAFAAAHPAIGIGTSENELIEQCHAMARSQVVLCCLLDGTIYKHDADIQTAVNAYANKYCGGSQWLR